jgi:hypothetical protein
MTECDKKWYSCCRCPYQFQLPNGIVIQNGHETAYCWECWKKYERSLLDIKNERGVTNVNSEQ